MQPILIKNKTFVEKHYQNQIDALKYFFQESGVKNIPNSQIKFGGGTALAMYFFQHRLSFDIDLFVSDIQYLDFVRPKIWIEESSLFNSNEYIDVHNHVGLITTNKIKVDTLVDSNSLEGYIDKSRQIVDFDLYIEDIKDIISKKITFRKKDNKTRDIIDIATAIENDSQILHSLITLEKINIEDLKDLRNALVSLNRARYDSQLKIVKPFADYVEISENAPKIIIDSINTIIN